MGCAVSRLFCKPPNHQKMLAMEVTFNHLKLSPSRQIKNTILISRQMRSDILWMGKASFGMAPHLMSDNHKVPKFAVRIVRFSCPCFHYAKWDNLLVSLRPFNLLYACTIQNQFWTFSFNIISYRLYLTLALLLYYPTTVRIGRIKHCQEL